MFMRHYSLCDQLVSQFDETLQAFNAIPMATRPNPSDSVSETELNPSERRHAGGLMRVNHVGEICAQALYHGQAMTTRLTDIQKKLQNAAKEEVDHLAWCQQRLQELNMHPSYLNPFWYTSALLIGLIAGLLGDKISLGFLAATEHQVKEHLDKHLQSLPRNDKKSRAIVKQMCLEEMEHATTAEQAGAVPLPLLIQWGMRGLAKLMTVIAYRI
jgi:ubiquinone biosynthesis monooxygenase Coq7